MGLGPEQTFILACTPFCRLYRFFVPSALRAGQPLLLPFGSPFFFFLFFGWLCRLWHSSLFIVFFVSAWVHCFVLSASAHHLSASQPAVILFSETSNTIARHLSGRFTPPSFPGLCRTQPPLVRRNPPAWCLQPRNFSSHLGHLTFFRSTSAIARSFDPVLGRPLFLFSN